MSRSNSRAKSLRHMKERRRCAKEVEMNDLTGTAGSVLKQAEDCLSHTRKKKLKAKKQAKDEIYNPILRLIKAYNY